MLINEESTKSKLCPMSSLIVFGMKFGAVGLSAVTLARRARFAVALLRQLAQAKGAILNVVGVDKPFTVALAVQESYARGAPPVRVLTPPRLHRPASVEAGNSVRGNTILFINLAVEQLATVRVVPRKVEEVYAREDDQEPAKKRNGIHGISGIETFEEDKRRAKRSRGEGDVVERVDTAKLELVVFQVEHT